MYNLNRHLMLGVLGFSLTLGGIAVLPGCENDAGDDIEEVGESLGDKADDVGDKIEEAGKDLKREVEDAVD